MKHSDLANWPGSPLAASNSARDTPNTSSQASSAKLITCFSKCDRSELLLLNLKRFGSQLFGLPPEPAVLPA